MPVRKAEDTMTINIEYETDKPLDVDYEKVANDIIPAALDYEKCPYEAEVNLPEGAFRFRILFYTDEP